MVCEIFEVDGGAAEASVSGSEHDEDSESLDPSSSSVDLIGRFQIDGYLRNRVMRGSQSVFCVWWSRSENAALGAIRLIVERLCSSRLLDCS